jgi:tetratricopeptide (TPR) repeat protein
MKPLLRLLLVFALLSSFTCRADDVTVSLSSADIEKTLQEIAPHAARFPPKFASKEERVAIEQRLGDLLVLLDGASQHYPDDPAMLFYQGFANSMGHNLDLPGCDQKASAAYEQLLKLQPDNKQANYYYGSFLAETALIPKSIPYLQKAIQLGVTDAHYTLAFVYLKQSDPQSALPEFKAYLAVHPENQQAEQMVAAIESGQLRIVRREAKSSAEMQQFIEQGAAQSK